MSKGITLGYWNIRGLAEPIRYLLYYKNVPFDDKRYTFENKDDWFEKDKFNLRLDFPNLPYFIDGDVRLTQSITILRYLAKKYHLDGKNEKEQLQASLVEQQIIDLRWNMIMVVLSDKFEEKKAEFIKSAPEKLKLLDNFLGDRNFLIGSDVTFVDFLAYDTFDFYRLFAPELCVGFPRLRKYVERIKTLPQLQKYMGSPAYVKWPIFGPIAKWGFAEKVPDHI